MLFDFSGMSDQSNFIRNYEKELARLLGNDKNVINALTELANVNKPRANEIVGVIEKTIRKVKIIFFHVSFMIVK